MSSSSSSSSSLPLLAPPLITLQNENNRTLALISGVVIGFTRPKETMPGANDKYSASYAIADNTLIDTNTNRYFYVTLVLFGNNILDFPLIVGAGNILICSKVAVQHHKGAIQLRANVRKSSYKVIYEKSDYITGYRPGLHNSNLDTTLENKLKECITVSTNHICTKQLIALTKGRITSLHSPPYIVFDHNSDPTKLDILNYTPLTPIEIRYVKLMFQWADTIFIHVSMSDLYPLPASAAQPLDYLTPVPPVTPLAHTTYTNNTNNYNNNNTSFNHLQASTIPTHVDLICIIVQVIIPTPDQNGSNALNGQAQNSSTGTNLGFRPAELIVWDGSTDGFFSPNVHIVSNTNTTTTSTTNNNSSSSSSSTNTNTNNNDNSAISIFNQIHNSFSAASTYNKENLNTINNIHTYYSDITDNMDLTNFALSGRPVCLYINDSTILTYLTTLKSGTWVRIRNVHTFVTPLSTSSNHIECVGNIYTDTHITPLYPYFK